MQATASITPTDRLQAAATATVAAPGRPLVLAPPLAQPGIPLPPAPSKAGLWKLVSPYVWSNRWALILCVMLNSMAGFAIAAQTVAPAYLMDHVLNAKGLTMLTRYERLGLLILGYLFLAVVMRMYAWYGSYKIFVRVRENIILELRSRFFRHINSLCLRFHGRHSSGELFTYVMGSPLSEISNFYHSLAMNAPNAISLFLCAVILLGSWDWGMTLILIVSVVLTVISTNSGHGKLRDLMQDFQDAESKVIGKVADIFRGNRDVKMYAIEDKMSATFDQTADMLRQKVYDRDLKTHHVNMQPGGGGHHLLHPGVPRVGGPLHERPPDSAASSSPTWRRSPCSRGRWQLMFQLGVARGKAQASAYRLHEMLDADSYHARTAPMRRPSRRPRTTPWWRGT